MTTSAPDLTVVADDRAESNIALWNQFMSKEKISRKISPLISLDAPIQPDKVRFVCISDTHEVLEKLLPKIPMGDVLLHSGDFTNFGSRKAIRAFNEQIGSLPHPHKIVIAGNHEMGFDSPTRFCNGTYQGYKLLTNCTYLENSFTEVYGIRIYGTPHHFLNHWAYYCQPGKEILQKWLNIPTYISDTPIDVLMTHTPHSAIWIGWTMNGTPAMSDAQNCSTVWRRESSQSSMFLATSMRTTDCLQMEKQSLLTPLFVMMP